MLTFGIMHFEFDPVHGEPSIPTMLMDSVLMKYLIGNKDQYSGRKKPKAYWVSNHLQLTVCVSGVWDNRKQFICG